MKLLRNLLFVLILATGCSLQAQTHIYSRYASHTDLGVAYVPNFKLDSINTVNVTVIMAQDSVAWEWLKAEFRIPELSEDELHQLSLRNTVVSLQFRDKNDPTQKANTSASDRCMLSIDHTQHILFIYQYDTMEQFYSVISYSSKKLKL